MIRKYLFFLVFLLISAAVFCQTEEVAEPEAEVAAKLEVPDRFNGIVMGMDMESVKEKLYADPNFNFRGDPDVSLLLRPNESLIECTGFSYIDRAFFQFYQKKLYIIILMLNKEKIDHYSVYTGLNDKYGEPSSLSPSKTVWESEYYSFSLERPLNIKYIDKTVFEALLMEGRAVDSLRILSREQFLDQF